MTTGQSAKTENSNYIANSVTNYPSSGEVKGRVQVKDCRIDTDLAHGKVIANGKVTQISLYKQRDDSIAVIINLDSGYEVFLADQLIDEIVKMLTTEKLKANG